MCPVPLPVSFTAAFDMDIRVSRLQRSSTTGKVMEELERETLKDTYMSSLGYGLVVM